MPNIYALISVANLVTITDKLGLIYSKLVAAIDGNGNAGDLAGDITDTVIARSAESEYWVVKDLIEASQALSSGMTADISARSLMSSFINALSAHCANRGREVATAINTIDSYATYENTSTFNTLLFSPEFNLLITAVTGTGLSVANIFSPEISPTTSHSNGLGAWSQAGGFVDGDSVAKSGQNYIYLGAKPKLVVTTGIVKDVSNIVITVTGVANDGTTGTWIYTGTSTIANGNYDFTSGTKYTKYIRDITTIEVTGSPSAGAFRVDGLLHRTPA